VAASLKSSVVPGGTLPVAEAISMASLFPLTVGQYQRMIDQGIVPEDNTVELLHGVLVRKDRSSPGDKSMGHSPLHRLIISLLTQLASRINNSNRFVQIQLPVICPPDGAPEPDAAVVRGTPRDYSQRLPEARDVFSVIEVAHSSLNRDRDDKLPIYASMAIAQCLIVNLNNSTVEVFEEPDAGSQRYRKRTVVISGGRVGLKVGESETFDFDAAEILP